MIDRLKNDILLARQEHRRLVDWLVDDQLDDLSALAEAMARTLGSGGKLLFFGNGGSAALAQELAGEFVNRYREERGALAALALTVNTSVLTSIGNDLAFREVFARQIEAVGRPGDLALGISTSGASDNVTVALRRATELGLVPAALLGRDGGECAGAARLALCVPGSDTARIQEIQMFAGHLLCHWVEQLLGLEPERSAPGPAPARGVRLPAGS